MREVQALGALLTWRIAPAAKHQQQRQVSRERGVRLRLQRTLLPEAKLQRKRKMARLPRS